jgi:hypothetical protein
MNTPQPSSSLQSTASVNLDAIAESLNKHPAASIVEQWLAKPDDKRLHANGGSKKRTLPPSSSLDTSTRTAFRPARLGVGAKPVSSSTAAASQNNGQTRPSPFHQSQSVFANYQLKMRLSGEERLGKDGGKAQRDDDLSISARTARKYDGGGNVRKKEEEEGEEEESRAKSVGKRSAPLIAHDLASSSGGKRGKKHKKQQHDSTKK